MRSFWERVQEGILGSTHRANFKDVHGGFGEETTNKHLVFDFAILGLGGGGKEGTAKLGIDSWPLRSLEADGISPEDIRTGCRQEGWRPTRALQAGSLIETNGSRGGCHRVLYLS